MGFPQIFIKSAAKLAARVGSKLPKITPSEVGGAAGKLAKSVPNPLMSRRSFTQTTGAAGAVNAAKSLGKKALDASPIGGIKKLMNLRKDAAAAKDLVSIANGENRRMSRRGFLRGASKRAGGMLMSKRKEVAGGISKVAGAVTDPYGTAGRISGVKLGKGGELAKKITDTIGFRRARSPFLTNFRK